MAGPEQKVIEIKNATDTDIKDKLSVNQATFLKENTPQSFKNAFEQHLRLA